MIYVDGLAPSDISPQLFYGFAAAPRNNVMVAPARLLSYSIIIIFIIRHRHISESWLVRQGSAPRVSSPPSGEIMWLVVVDVIGCWRCRAGVLIDCVAGQVRERQRQRQELLIELTLNVPVDTKRSSQLQSRG